MYNCFHLYEIHMVVVINIVDDFTEKKSQASRNSSDPQERGKDMNLADFREYDKLATFERLVGAILMLQTPAVKKKVFSSFWVNLGRDLRAIELVGTDYSGLFRNFVDSKLRFKSIGHQDETFAIVAKSWMQNELPQTLLVDLYGLRPRLCRIDWYLIHVRKQEWILFFVPMQLSNYR